MPFSTSALRSVAATKDLLELHIKRDEFASAVLENLTADLLQNGLKLETVTISQLDQTPPESLNSQNVFDAQGLRKITEITQSPHNMQVGGGWLVGTVPARATLAVF